MPGCRAKDFPGGYSSGIVAGHLEERVYRPDPLRMLSGGFNARVYVRIFFLFSSRVCDAAFLLLPFVRAVSFIAGRCMAVEGRIFGAIVWNLGRFDAHSVYILPGFIFLCKAKNSAA